MNDEYLPIFVYGTLQQGEERGGHWPFPPLSVERATIRGCLHDLGTYPALVDGDGIVFGELWHLRASHMAETLRLLDEIECFGKDEVDLYIRRTVECRTLDGAVHRAYAYYFADPDSIRDRPKVTSDQDGASHWRRKK